MTLTNARLMARQFLRAGKSATAYSETEVDRAIQTVGQQFCTNTRSVKVIGTVALVASASTVVISGLTGFSPEGLISAYITTQAEPLELLEWEDLRKREIDNDAEAVPTALAWASSDGLLAQLHPTPDAIYSLKLRYAQEFTSFTAGTAAGSASDAVVFNIPDESMNKILAWGVPGLMQGNEPEMKYARESWAKYLAYERSMIGAGELGARVQTRAMME